MGGGSTTFFDAELAEEMSMKGVPRALALVWKDGEPPIESMRVMFSIANVESGEEFLVEASTHGAMRLHARVVAGYA